MTTSPITEILKAGEFALEYTPGRLDELTVEEIVDVVGRAVLHAAAERIRAAADSDCPNDDPRWNGMNHAADLIDPPEAT